MKKNSNIIGKTTQEIKEELDYKTDIVRIIRDGNNDLDDIESVKFLEHDVLIVQINADNILKFKNHCNLLILPDIKMSQSELEGENHVIVEAIVNHQSSLIGKTLSESNFRMKIIDCISVDYVAKLISTWEEKYLLNEDL